MVELAGAVARDVGTGTVRPAVDRSFLVVGAVFVVDDV